MSRKTTKIIFLVVILIAVIGTGIGVYAYSHSGPIVGKIDFGTSYYLSEIRPTERFKGATMNSGSYFQINLDRQTGNLYLAGLEASDSPIPFIVTSYKEGVKSTIIDFEYIIGAGNDTQIQRLQAVSTNTEIRIKTVETHGVQDVITQNPTDIDSLEYSVTILVFRKEVAV